MSNEADQADELIELSTSLRLDQNARKLQPNDVTECMDCLADIPPDRLKALPSAKRCLDCEELSEVLA